tara:strand:+ start:210 stop:380 length:171 start_codon:yes stop_codon:yes gene_type:complete
MKILAVVKAIKVLLHVKFKIAHQLKQRMVQNVASHVVKKQIKHHPEQICSKPCCAK